MNKLRTHHQFSPRPCRCLDIHNGEGACNHFNEFRAAHMPQTNFRDGKGKVYMTHPTKALHKFMMQDFVRMRYAQLHGVKSWAQVCV